jgi:DNA-binding transcriptional LysR family regulator
MDSGDLRIFQMVARTGSITQAADRLGYVQSNVTARIRQLEAELGTVLFHRHNRGMTPTSSGIALLAYADRILRLMDEAFQSVASSSEPRGPLAIGSTQSCAAVRLPKLLADYHRKYPDVQLSLLTGNSARMTESVLRCEVDGAFVSDPVLSEELEAIPAFEEELVLVCREDCRSLEDAAASPLLVFSGGCTYRAVLEQWLRENRWKPPQTMEFGTLETILGGVEAGLGVSLLPRSLISAQTARRLAVFRLPDRYSRSTTFFVRRKDAFVSCPLRLFIELLPSAEAQRA